MRELSDVRESGGEHTPIDKDAFIVPRASPFVMTGEPKTFNHFQHLATDEDPRDKSVNRKPLPSQAEQDDVVMEEISQEDYKKLFASVPRTDPSRQPRRASRVPEQPPSAVEPDPDKARTRLVESLTNDIKARKAAVVSNESRPASLADEVAAVRGASRQELFSELANNLELPFLAGKDGGPSKPGRQVIFTIERFGSVSFNYHEVIESGAMLILVYDTRYGDGAQFVFPKPRDNGYGVAEEVPIEVYVPDSGRRYTDMVSFGLQFSLGKLDIIVLLGAHEHEDVN